MLRGGSVTRPFRFLVVSLCFAACGGGDAVRAVRPSEHLAAANPEPSRSTPSLLEPTLDPLPIAATFHTEPPSPAPIAETREESAKAEWSPSEPLVAHEDTHVIVLMYHSIDRGKAVRGVSPAVLDAQLRYLEDGHVAFAPIHELVRFLDRERELPASVAVLTIDDGELDFYDLGFAVFKEHRAPFVLGLPTAAIEQSKDRGLTMSWDMIREIMSSGLCEVASHGQTHRALRALPTRDLRFEIETPRTLIEKNLGVRPEVFFYPMGSSSSEALTEVERAGYKAAFGAVGHPIDGSTLRYAIPRFGVTRSTTPFIMSRLLHAAGIELASRQRW